MKKACTGVSSVMIPTGKTMASKISLGCVGQEHMTNASVLSPPHAWKCTCETHRGGWESMYVIFWESRKKNIKIVNVPIRIEAV